VIFEKLEEDQINIDLMINLAEEAVVDQAEKEEITTEEVSRNTLT